MGQFDPKKPIRVNSATSKYHLPNNLENIVIFLNRAQMLQF